MQSHVDDLGKNGEPLFSRDCAEYEFQIGKNKLLVLANHYKSKRFGSGTDSDTRRKAQAERVAAIYNERKEEGWKYIVVAGDLNDTPDSKPLAPLIKKTDLKDASELTGWVWGEREGTFGGSNKEPRRPPAPVSRLKRWQKGSCRRTRKTRLPRDRWKSCLW